MRLSKKEISIFKRRLQDLVSSDNAQLAIELLIDWMRLYEADDDFLNEVLIISARFRSISKNHFEKGTISYNEYLEKYEGCLQRLLKLVDQVADSLYLSDSI